MLSLDDKAKLNDVKSGAEALEMLSTMKLKTRMQCLRHGGSCCVPSPDINIFGAPCVDDSCAGKKSMDDGVSRRAPLIELVMHVTPNSQ